jgi:hypothetical protein
MWNAIVHQQDTEQQTDSQISAPAAIPLPRPGWFHPDALVYFCLMRSCVNLFGMNSNSSVPAGAWPMSSVFVFDRQMVMREMGE